MFYSCTSIVGCLFTWMMRAASAQNPIFGNQGGFINNDPQNQQASTNTYYFDRNSDCNKQARNIYDTSATIYGFGSGTAQQGPESCTIKIKSEQQFAGTTLYIEIRSMAINNCDTIVTIYDGDGDNGLLGLFDCKSGLQLNQRTIKTSGNTATFMMVRRDTNQFNFNVQINIRPIRGGTTGLDPELGSYFFDKFDQKAIVGIVGSFYLVVLICCLFCIGYQWRSFHGLTKEWETRQLATIKTNAGFDGQSQVTSFTHPWSTTHSRPPPSQYSRTHTDVYSRRYRQGSEDGDSGVFRYDDDFQKRQLMNEKTRMKGGPPTYTSRNDSNIEPEDAEDTFTEKVITPRVHTRSNRRRNGRRRSSHDESFHSESEEESEEETDSNESTRKQRLSSEESDRTTSTSGSETEEEDTQTEEESDASSSRRGRRSKGARWKPQRDKRRRNQKKGSSRDSHDSRDSRDTRDSRSTAASRRRGPPQPPTTGYPAPHPAMHPAYPPGQFVPVMAAPPALQPVQMVPAYSPQPYPGVDPRAPPSGAAVQGTDPPVYSYLVRRGYTPLDAQSEGSGLSHRSGVGRLEEPETRLSSGVEYMRR